MGDVSCTLKTVLAKLKAWMKDWADTPETDN